MPQVEVWKKIRSRGERRVPEIGDRVPYLIIVKSKRVADCAEDPLYVLENRLEINKDYYIKNQLRNPIENLFSVIQQLPSDIWKNTSIHNSVFGRPKEGTLDTFMIRKTKCQGCNCIIYEDGKESIRMNFCKQCSHLKQAVTEREIAEMKVCVENRKLAWNRCYSCVRESNGEVDIEDLVTIKSEAKSCRNLDCDNFYVRAQSDELVRQNRHKLEQLNIM